MSIDKYVIDDGKNKHLGYDATEADDEIVAALTTRTFNTLDTTAKTIIAAINEVASGGAQTWQPLKNNKTNLWVTIPELDKNIELVCRYTSGSTFNINWGDGTNEDVTGAGTSTSVFTSHTYAAAGDYVINITGGSSLNLGGANSSQGLIKKNTGFDFTKLKNLEVNHKTTSYALTRNYGCENIFITKSCSTIGDECFEYCYSLKSVEFEERVAGITFEGNYTFGYCYGLKSIILCSSYELPNNFLNSCYALEKVIVPSFVTELANSMVQNCHGLNEVEIGDTTQSIGAQFGGCENFMILRMKPTTPPSVSSLSLRADTIIYVPRGYLETYQTASGWSTYSTQMVEE